ncbi:hypothetical protein BX070DRAFT_224562 [Coemansia spiralis]|nr:hypothetical protein BX070DRAFT_224562 [Coemansia spiralis]
MLKWINRLKWVSGWVHRGCGQPSSTPQVCCKAGYLVQTHVCTAMVCVDGQSS